MKGSIRRIQPEETGPRLAQLIYATDRPLFRFMFGSEAKALTAIERLTALDNNTFSCRFIHGYFEDDRLLGIMAGYDSTETESLDEKSDFSAIFSTRELFWILLKYPVIRALDVKPDLNGYYIQNLSVDPEHRGKGIGTQLLEYASSHSIEKGIQSLYLDVDLENSKARNLYERMGFRVIRKIRLLFPCLGVYRMEKKHD